MESVNLSRREMRFFDVAKAVSRTSNFHGNHMGCCVVSKGVVVSVGCNGEKTHPMQKTYNNFRNFDIQKYPNKIHAEVHALSLLISRKNDIDWQKTSIYIYRELKNGKPALSKPCLACMQLIKDLGISYIYYVNENGKFCKDRV